jgi:N-acetylneuraminic acid mutarotase
MRSLKRVPNTYIARIDANGRLGEWKTAPALPAARFHHPALHHKGWIYVVGGQGEKEAEAGIFAAKLNADGTITAWTSARPLPRARSHHAAFVYENNLYVVGGLDGAVQGHGAIFVDVIRAPIAEDGSIGEWRIVSRMPHSYATHAAFGHDGYLWVMGGVEDNNRFVADIWRAAVGADGRVGGWEAVTPALPVARGHVHNTPVLRGFVYTVGGRMLPTTPAEPFLVNGAAHIGRFVR